MGLASGVYQIAEERERQKAVEGWTDEHDDKHNDDSLAIAAACYAMPANMRLPAIQHSPSPAAWPWDDEWWKPSKFRIKELRKAGALIAAEIDRLERLAEQA